MAACRLRCAQCGTAFYGRADARYCGGACRQKAYRRRMTRRAPETVHAIDLGNTVTRARQTQQLAHDGSVHLAILPPP
jgi:hypothetical protein